MFKAFKYLGLFIAAIMVVTIGGAFLISILPPPVYSAGDPEIDVKITPARVAEGRRIAIMICGKCHFDERTNSLAGEIVTNPAEIGDSYAANITADEQTGIGKWTDGQIAYLLRTGVKPNGQFVFDMPKYPNLADEDLISIIAFLRSGDSLVRAVNNKVIQPRPNAIIKLLGRTLFKPYKYPEGVMLMPDTNNPVQFGEYLATKKFSCYECHSNDLVGNFHNDEPQKSNHFFGGGAPHTGDNHDIVYSSNLTFDKETGIGNWSEEDFVKALKSGIKPNGEVVKTPMYPFYLLSDKEAKAIFKYLSTLPTFKSKKSATSNVR